MDVFRLAAGSYVALVLVIELTRSVYMPLAELLFVVVLKRAHPSVRVVVVNLVVVLLGDTRSTLTDAPLTLELFWSTTITRQKTF